jgi:hypothetical protein
MEGKMFTIFIGLVSKQFIFRLQISTYFLN